MLIILIVVLAIVCLEFTRMLFSPEIKQRQTSGLYLAAIIVVTLLILQGVIK